MPTPDQPDDEKNGPEDTGDVPESDELTPETPETSTPSTGGTGDQKVTQAQPNHADTVKILLAPYENRLKKETRPAAPFIREVLTAVYKSNPDFTTKYSESWLELRSVLRKRLDVSPALVDKELNAVLLIAKKDKQGEGSFPAGPVTPAGPKITAPIPGPTGGEATDAATPPGGDPADEPFVWTERKVGAVMGGVLNMPGWALAEWPDVIKEEREDLGKSFLEMFKEYFPTNKKAGMLMVSLAAIEMIARPRVMAVIQVHAMKKMLPDQARADAIKKINEMWKVEEEDQK